MIRVPFPRLSAVMSRLMLMACLTIVLAITTKSVLAADCAAISCGNDEISCLRDKQACWESKIKQAQDATITLSNTISILNGQISVQELLIRQTQIEIAGLESQITELSDRIAGLEVSLDRLSTLLVERIRSDYKQKRSIPTELMLFSSGLDRFLSNLKYLAEARRHTAQAMERAETQRLTYDEQKKLKEEKQAEVEAKYSQLAGQQAQLTQQRSEQQFLLSQTRNDESRYQSELAKTLSELSAIQSIIAGQGSESKVGEVNQGDRIASIIVGASSCSNGSHLHLEVIQDGYHQDPANFLKSVDILWNNSPDGPFSFSGGWEWPMNNPAKLNQGYGMTWYARARYYGGAPHTGIDMSSKSSGDYTVKAIKKGTLYRGSIACGGGLLRYVRVDHAEDDYDTYYLHINY